MYRKSDLLLSLVHGLVNIQGLSEMGSKQTLPVTEDESIFAFKEMIKNNGLSDPRLYYQFLDLLGEGCYSEVYRVRSKDNGQVRAIKKMRKSHDPRVSCHLINQFQILRQMDHPNIVKMFEMFDDGTHHYIVTEYLEGKDALEMLQKRKVVPQQLAFNIFYQVTLAINYLHRNSFMHRDIKLENIIFNEQNNSLKLIDFGSALKFAQSAPRQRRCTGTIHYIAPEVINKFYNNKCDIWSLGILLYVLLSGNAPFIGKEHQTIINKILKEPLTFNNPIWNTRSKESISLITRMLEKNFETRIGISEILSDPWICRFRSGNVIYKPENELIVSSLQNMVKFTKARLNEIQLRVVVFMINVIIRVPNEVGLMKVFNRLDYKEDGEIDEGEVRTALVSFLELPAKRAELLAKEFMAKIDLDTSGFINFTEFVVAASNLREILTPLNIELAFNFIDTDHSGGLSLSQLKARLGNNIDNSYYMKIIRTFNRNGDEFTKKDFQLMMREILASY